MLHDAAILVAEDEPFIALGLAMAIEDAGGAVMGPAASVREALALLAGMPVAAILDVNLTDRDITPVVEILMARDIPLIIQTVVGVPPDLAARFPGLVVFIKPTAPAHLVLHLVGLIDARGHRPVRH